MENEFLDFLKMFNDWPVGTILGILMTILALVLITIVVMGIYTAIDSWFVPEYCGGGTVVGKQYTASWLQVMNVGQMVNIINHPATWTLVVKVEERQATVNVKRSYYHSVSTNETIRVAYGYGRLSRSLYIKGVYQ